MTQQNPLDITGSLQSNPLAEILIEIGTAGFNGSLRLSNNDQKTVVYFDNGDVIFGVSNSKALRLFNVMLQQKKIEKNALMKHTNFSNDLEFAQSLERTGGFSTEEVAEMFTLQIDAIVVDALSWPKGEWHFSPLARLRKDVRYTTNANRVLLDHARCLPSEAIAERFRSVKESFTVDRDNSEIKNLQPHEAYVISRFQDDPLTVEQLREMSSLPEAALLQTLYVLWLSGVLIRREWSAAFTPTKIAQIHGAKITRVKEAENLAVADVKVDDSPETPPEHEVVPVAKAAELTITLDEYLDQIENSETHYDTLGLEMGSDITAIKQMYFGLAKLFHPDKFHRESAEIQKRIQTSFTGLSYAYETLKSKDSREAYNFKMAKEIDMREDRRKKGEPDADSSDKKSESAFQAFEQALIHLKKEEYDEAAALLARAVHYSPDNAQFHAYYGQALSVFEGKTHAAESEFQKAIKIDPTNSKIRMMLVDFFIDIDMNKRAIGELNRFLELVPGDKDAIRRLERIQK